MSQRFNTNGKSYITPRCARCRELAIQDNGKSYIAPFCVRCRELTTKFASPDAARGAMSQRFKSTA